MEAFDFSPPSRLLWNSPTGQLIGQLFGKCLLSFDWYLHYIKSERDGPFLKYVNACRFV